MGNGWSQDGYPDDWDSRRKSVYARDGHKCQNCGAKGGPIGNTELHCHHIVPKSEGGSHDKSNLTTLCHDCHNEVHDHHVPKMSEVASGQSSNSTSKPYRASDGPEPDHTYHVNENLEELTLCADCHDRVYSNAIDPSPEIAVGNMTDEEQQAILETLYARSDMSAGQLEQYAAILGQTPPPTDGGVSHDIEPGSARHYAIVAFAAACMLISIPATLVAPWITFFGVAALLIVSLYQGQVN